MCAQDYVTSCIPSLYVVDVDSGIVSYESVVSHVANENVLVFERIYMCGNEGTIERHPVETA